MKTPFHFQEIFDRARIDFDATALDIFRFQFEYNSVYRAFASSFKRTPDSVKSILDIPFLPVEFFKTHQVYSGSDAPETVFTSSGTTGSVTSRHHIFSIQLYRESFIQGFRNSYGDPEEFTFLFLLPSYLERNGSSLVFMAEELKKLSRYADSGFYLHNYEELRNKINTLCAEGRKNILLLGVTYALLDLAELFPGSVGSTIVMETGGMKGKRKEITREELHADLTSAFDIKEVHSEYGMTELLSQAYSKGNGIFRCPPWMKVITRDTGDPLSFASPGQTGGINIIDLANMYSCSFISTSDLGKVYDDGSFEILGRFDHSDVRGCNLLMPE